MLCLNCRQIIHSGGGRVGRILDRLAADEVGGISENVAGFMVYWLYHLDYQLINESLLNSAFHLENNTENGMEIGCIQFTQFCFNSSKSAI